MIYDLQVGDSVVLTKDHIGVGKGALGKVTYVSKNKGIGFEVKVQFPYNGIAVVHSFQPSNCPLRKM